MPNYTINDFSGGIQSANQNPLNWPANAIRDGQNFYVRAKALQTRPGVQELWNNGTGGETLESIVQIKQVTLPTPAKSYLLIQGHTGTGDTLYVTDATQPMDENSVLTTLKSLGVLTKNVNICVLNDRVIIAGQDFIPQVWAGGLSDDGSDWAVPKQIMFSTNGTASSDITNELCDADTTTTLTVGSIGSGGYLNICSDMATLTGLYFKVETANTNSVSMTLERWTSAGWTSVADWIDGTVTAGKTLATTGCLTGTAATADYGVVDNVPGYWFRVKFGTGCSASTKISRILFQAPCQALASIGDGQPDKPVGVLFWVNASKSINDFTIDLIDYSDTSKALNNGNVDTPVGMTANDELYIGFPKKFSAIDISLYPNSNNIITATMSAYYYKAGAWSALTITDGTSVSFKTLAQSGKVSWAVPTDWDRCSPLSAIWPHCYWVKVKVNATLTSTVELTEIGVLPQEEPLKAHSHCFRFRDRIVLMGSTENVSQIEISRSFEEYGWSGPDYWVDQLPGADPIVAALETYNQGWIWRARDLWMLNGYNPDTFSLERAEIANRCPVNQNCIVQAPVLESDDKSKMGFYFLSHEGVYYFTGLQLYKLSEQVPWFDEGVGVPYIEHAYLNQACGVYYAAKNWICWAVPMRLGVSAQTTNNVLICYDLTLKCWLPLQTIALTCMGVVRDTDTSSPSQLGRERIFGGTADGKILMVFDPSLATDEDVPIEGSATIGWLDFGQPGIPKRINQVTIYGRTAGESISFSLYRDGNTDDAESWDETDVADQANVLFARAPERRNYSGFFFQCKLETTDSTDIYAIDFEYSVPPGREG